MAAVGGVFICYRRLDSGGWAVSIRDRIAKHIAPEHVFLDVDSIKPGEDFVERLRGQVGACDALVAVIGRHWVSSVDEANGRRIDDPEDFVRIEIQTALNRGINIFPVLVDYASMPKKDQLPSELQKLTTIQAIEISGRNIDAEVEKLSQWLSSAMEEGRRNREAAEAERLAREEQRREAEETREAENETHGLDPVLSQQALRALTVSVTNGVGELRAYVILHGILQSMGVEIYPYLIHEINLLRHDPRPRDVLSLYISNLRRLCDEASLAAEGLKETSERLEGETRWIEALSAAAAELEASGEQVDRISARHSMLTIRAVLAREPPRIMRLLSGAAEALPIENLIYTFDATRLLPRLSDSQRQTLSSAKELLAVLWGDLRDKVAILDRWQDVEIELSAADDELERNSRALGEDFHLYWAIIKEKVKPIWELDPSAPWVVKTRELGNAVDAGLNTEPIDLKLAQSKFRRFRTRSLDQFFVALMELRSLCEQILDLNGPLNAILTE